MNHSSSALPVNVLRENLEADRLLSDFPYYAANQLRIKGKSGAMQPFIFNRAQDYIHTRLEEQKARVGYVRALVLKGRQQGCSTYVGGRYFHTTVSEEGVLTFIFAHDSESSGSLYTMVETFLEQPADPKFMPKIGASNQRELLFPSLMSGYKVGTAGSKGLGRSKTIKQLHWSEVAYSPNSQDHAAGIMQTVPLLAGTEIILESTANGQGDYFHRMCMQALSGEGDYQLIFVPWYWQPEYTREVPDGFEMNEQEREYMDVFGADGLTLEHIIWRRRKIADEFEGEDIRFKKEYPFTPEEAFEVSDDESFIKAISVRKARNAQPVPTDAPLIIGADPARLGGDRFRLVFRKGRNVVRAMLLPPMRVDESAERLAQIINQYNPVKVNIDSGGLGVGVYDILIGKGFNEQYQRIKKVDFGGKATDSDRYGNKRAEMYGRSKIWLNDEPVCIMGLTPREADMLQAELSVGKAKWRNNSELIIEPKEDIKKRLGYSPDLADAFVLTFAEEVANAATQGGMHVRAVTKPIGEIAGGGSWSPFDS